MEVYLPALLGNKVGPSNQPTDRQTGGVIGKLNFKKKKDIPTTARLHSQIGGVIGKLNFKKKEGCTHHCPSPRPSERRHHQGSAEWPQTKQVLRSGLRIKVCCQAPDLEIELNLIRVRTRYWLVNGDWNRARLVSRSIQLESK